MRSFMSHLCVALAAIGATWGLFTALTRYEQQQVTCSIDAHKLQGSVPPASQLTLKTFDFDSIQGLSKKQLTEHYQLYKGYLDKRNMIVKELIKTDRSDVASSYSHFRALKMGETFTLNGVILHELYFENLKAGTTMGEATQQLLVEQFGSIESFKQDLFDSATCARGWVLTGLCLADGRVYNFVLDAHNQTVPLMTVPLLIVDTYEHAYMIDFGINRKAYLNTIWETINWDVVEQRVQSLPRHQ